MSEDLPVIGFIGAGRVATTLARGLDGVGYAVAAIASRRLASAEALAAHLNNCRPCRTEQEVVDSADIIFITTPDDAIAVVDGSLRWDTDKSAVHCSGADTRQLLSKAAADGALTGVFHPLQTIAGGDKPENRLQGITFSIEAEEPLLSQLKDMAVALGGRWMVLKPQDRALYHASAVIASNYTVALVKMATDLWADFGISRQDALAALLPLIKGTVSNIEVIGLPACLTGPVSRGDVGTLEKHIDALGKNHPEIMSAYCRLGLQSVPIAIEKGKMDSVTARCMQDVFKHALTGEGLK